MRLGTLDRTLLSCGWLRIAGGSRWAMLVVCTLAALLPVCAQAQQPNRMLRIGVLNEAWAANHPTVEGLRAGLRELGFEEGRDVVFDIRFTQGKPQAAPAAAEALIRAGVDLIVTSSEAPTRAAKQATREIPIVFTLVGDPVEAGILRTIARPGGNVTGISSLTTELVAKRLEILHTLAPNAGRVWAIHDGDDPSSIAAMQRAADAAKQLKLELVSRPVQNERQLKDAIGDIRPGDALLPPDAGRLDIPAALLELSLTAGIPAVFTGSLWVGHGGLASYGSDYRAQGVQAARLVAKILRGARAGELPVEGADKIDLAVNVETASRLRLAVPRKILLRADTIRR